MTARRLLLALACLTGVLRVLGVRSIYDESGEDLSLIVGPVVA